MRFLSGLVGAAILASTADASIITATFNNVGPGSGGAFSLDGGANWNNTGAAGHFNWTRTGGNYLGAQGNFMSFCCELTEHIGGGSTYNFNVVPLDQGTDSIGGMGLAKADLINELFGRYYSPSFGSVLTADRATAMQLSIWEIVYENSATGPRSIATGNAMFTNDNAGAMALAELYLASLDGSGPRATDLAVMSAGGAQDQIIPAPGTIALAGLAGLCFRRRR
ncbi:MAG: hypothetical protein AABZ53_12680 [Planctomycetota bacterium]